jgi:hypothetical protein
LRRRGRDAFLRVCRVFASKKWNVSVSCFTGVLFHGGLVRLFACSPARLLACSRARVLSGSSALRFVCSPALLLSGSSALRLSGSPACMLACSPVRLLSGSSALRFACSPVRLPELTCSNNSCSLISVRPRDGPQSPEGETMSKITGTLTHSATCTGCKAMVGLRPAPMVPNRRWDAIPTVINGQTAYAVLPTLPNVARWECPVCSMAN